MKARAQGGASEGLWLRAKKQTGGIGRLGRKWESPEGNLYCSGLVDLRTDDPIASSLSFVAALAVFQTINPQIPKADIMLKWPNDILVNDAKICGILLERVGDQIVVGIGINVIKAPVIADRAVISLREAGALADCNAALIMSELAEKFAENVRIWRTSGLQTVLAEWEKHAHAPGTPITTSISKNEKITGKFAGLAEDGALRLRKADGALIEIRAGDIELA